MILNVSSRTDIIAFYSEWFKKRYEAGYVDVRNPFYEKMVSRIHFNHVDAIVFCTKNPAPIIDYLANITQPILFHITLTPYHSEIEPFVKDKREVIKDIHKLAKILPKEMIYVRYDPIFLSPQYTVDYHIRAFERLCQQLSGVVHHIIISFMDEYKNVKKNRHILRDRQMSDDEMTMLGTCFVQLATQYGMSLQTCAEARNLSEIGFIQADCVSQQLAFEITKKKFSIGTSRQKKCRCVEMADIGAYNTCSHYCRYCYANYDEQQIDRNNAQHDVNSSLLIGHLKADDMIKERK